VPPNPSAIPSTRRCRASFTAESAPYRAFLHAGRGTRQFRAEAPLSRSLGRKSRTAPRPIEQSLSLLRRCIAAFRPRSLGYQPSALVLGTGVEPATARPKPGALPTELTETGDDRFEPMSGTHGADPRSRSSRTQEAHAPLDGRHQWSKPSKRRRWESNPLKAALQAAAFPSGSDVGLRFDPTKVSSPGFEPDPRPSQGRVRSTTLRGPAKSVALVTDRDCVTVTGFPLTPGSSPARGEGRIWAQRLFLQGCECCHSSPLSPRGRGVGVRGSALPIRVVSFSTPPRIRTSSGSFEGCHAIQHTRGASCEFETKKHRQLTLAARTLRDCLDLDSNQDQDLRRVRCDPLHHRDSARHHLRPPALPRARPCEAHGLPPVGFSGGGRSSC
jgi:hypothetical protein